VQPAPIPKRLLYALPVAYDAGAFMPDGFMSPIKLPESKSVVGSVSDYLIKLIIIYNSIFHLHMYTFSQWHATI
jgi:hypothetical protein